MNTCIRKRLLAILWISPLSALSFSCASSTSSSIPSSLDKGYVVSSLRNGDDYKTKEFANAMVGIDASKYEFVNFMPKEVYDAYHVGAYFVKGPSNYESDYFLFHDGKAVNVSMGLVNLSSNNGFGDFLFTDFNHDGYPEVTVVYQVMGRLTDSYLFTFDTKTGQYVRSDSFHNTHCFFKIGERGPEIHGNGIENEKVDTSSYLIGEIVEYTRQFRLSKNRIDLVGESFDVTVSLDPGNTVIPLTYLGLTMRLEINATMTYKGETFSYTNPNTYKDGALPIFKHDEKELKMESWVAGQMFTDFTVTQGEVIDRTYYFLEKMGELNPIGTYDMSVSYKEETLFEKAALIIRGE